MAQQTQKQSIKSPNSPNLAQGNQPCRLDVWLYRTRLLKTRSLAARLISSGKVRITRNGQTERAKKTHTLIRAGDGITFMRGAQLIDVIMVEAGTRRGPAPEAQLLYDDLTGDIIAARSQHG